MACQYPSTHHSDDTVNVYHGAPAPMVLCGFHASQTSPALFEKVRNG